jgi:hypothetical protein
MGTWHKSRKGKRTGKKNVEPRIIIWAWGSLEADFLRFYKINLNHVHENNLISWRRFLVLVRELPETSAYYRFLQNKENRNFVNMDDDYIFDNMNKVKV